MNKAQAEIKRDTEENWLKAKNYRPIFGMIILYEKDGNITQLKIGDGETLVNDLPNLIQPNTKKVENGILTL